MPRERLFTAEVIPQIPERVEDFKTRIRVKKKPGKLEAVRQLFKGEGVRDSVATIHETISAKEKQRIFTPSIRAMKLIAQEHRIALPEEEVLLSRLLMVDNETFKQIYKQEKGGDTEVKNIHGMQFAIAVGAMFDNRICIIDSDALKNDKINTIRCVGIHELWHSVEYIELWKSNNGRLSSLETPRRSGIFTRYVDNPKKFSKLYLTGLYLLEEGFIDRCVRQTFKRAGEPLSRTKGLGYKNEMEIVDDLVELIGEGPFFQASFTKRGFRDLFVALGRSRTDRTSLLEQIASEIAVEHQSFSMWLALGGKNIPFPYPQTRELIREIKTGGANNETA